VGRRAGDRESQKTCRLSRSVNNGKVAGSRYEDTEPLEVEESWVQALSLQKDSRLFYLEEELAVPLLFDMVRHWGDGQFNWEVGHGEQGRGDICGYCLLGFPGSVGGIFAWIW